MATKAKRRLRHAATALLAAALAGCASVQTSPLATRQLQQDALDPRVGVVVLRFRTEGVPPAGTQFHDLLTRGGTLIPPMLRWRFAVANESTGWRFGELQEAGQVFRTRGDTLEPDAKSETAGWVSFLAPPGESYVAVIPGGFPPAGGFKAITRTPDRIAVGSSRTQGARGLLYEARIAVQVRQPREMVYAGTLVATLHCSDGKPLSCPYELTREDESGLAHAFVGRYLGHLAPASSLQTRLFAIPLSRTVKVRDGRAE